jgi:hypothetical protein
VYMTLRLERDGLVVSDGISEDGPQEGFRIRPRVRTSWRCGCGRRPTSRPPRDEVVIKVLIALRVPGVDVHEVMQEHRRYLMELIAGVDAVLRSMRPIAISGSLWSWTPSCFAWTR